MAGLTTAGDGNSFSQTSLNNFDFFSNPLLAEVLCF